MCTVLFETFFVLLEIRAPHCLSNCVKMGTGNDGEWSNKISKVMDKNFISHIDQKNMRWNFGTSYKLSNFQERESPAPLNIPTPTRAPDRGGPVACLGGPVTLRLIETLIG